MVNIDLSDMKKKLTEQTSIVEAYITEVANLKASEQQLQTTIDEKQQANAKLAEKNLRVERNFTNSKEAYNNALVVNKDLDDLVKFYEASTVGTKTSQYEGDSRGGHKNPANTEEDPLDSAASEHIDNANLPFSEKATDVHVAEQVTAGSPLAEDMTTIHVLDQNENVTATDTSVEIQKAVATTVEAQ